MPIKQTLRDVITQIPTKQVLLLKKLNFLQRPRLHYPFPLFFMLKNLWCALPHFLSEWKFLATTYQRLPSTRTSSTLYVSFVRKPHGTVR
jgi:hypothetical protein